MKEWKALVFLFGIVFICGCTIPGLTSTGTGSGLTMTMSLSDSSIDPGTQVQLALTIKNAGGAKATGIRADLNGLTQDWSISPGTSIGIPDLSGADPSHSFPGDSDAENWIISPPGLSTQISYPFSVRLTYNYETSDNVIVRVASFDYTKTNKITTGVISQTSTGAPITINVRAPNAIFSGSTVPVFIDFTNSGSGVVQGNSLNVDVSGSGISCPKSTVTLIQDNNGVGKNGYLRCTISTSGVSGWGQFTVQAHTSYTYTIEQFNSITVLAKTS